MTDKLKVAVLNLAKQNGDARAGDVTDDQVAIMVEAMDWQLQHHLYTRTTDFTELAFEFMPGKTTAPEGYSPFIFAHDADVAGALGYHDVDANGVPYTKVFTALVFEGPDPSLWAGSNSILVTGSHESIELAGDVDANKQVPRRLLKKLEAKERCDRCEGWSYEIETPSGHFVHVSDFLLDDAFDEEKPYPTVLDLMSMLNRGRDPAAIEIGEDGYVILEDPATGKVTELYGSRLERGRQIFEHISRHQASSQAFIREHFKSDDRKVEQEALEVFEHFMRRKAHGAGRGRRRGAFTTFRR